MSDSTENKPRSVKDQVRDGVADQFCVQPETVTDDASFTDDLGADQLDVVEFVMWLEDRFNIVVSEEDADRLTTLANTMAYLREWGVA